MAISIDWPSAVITVPKADLLLVQASPTEIRELDIDAFRLELKDLEDGAEGMPWPDTHSHNPPVTVGGVTLARVVEILEPYTITFEDDQYAVNLVGANSNIGDRTNVNQVSIRSANSAGLTYSKEVEDQSFTDSRVWVNTDTGRPGTQFPRGTPGDPVDNLDDARQIIINRGLPRRIHFVGTDTIHNGEDYSGYDIEGASPILSIIDVEVGCNTAGLVVRKLNISGELNNNFTAYDSTSLLNIIDFDGKLVGCGLDGTIDLSAGGASYDFINCYSEVPGLSTPIIDFDNITGVSSQFRSYTGGLEIRNFNDAGNSLSIDLLSGHVKIDSSCTAGTIVVRGTGHLTDNSNGATIVNTGLVAGDVQDLIKHTVAGNAVVSGDNLTVTIQDESGNPVRVLNVSSDGRVRTIQ